MIDIFEFEHLREVINASLNNGNSIELKPEREGVVAVQVQRSLKGKEEYKDRPKGEKK